jgi:membrane-associated phospholipid phosphatase
MVAATTLASSATRQRTLDRLALMVSAVFAPPVLAVPIALLTALRERQHPWAIPGGLLLLAATALIPSVYIYLEYRRGEVRTLELTTRAERRRPTTLAAVSAACAAAVLLVVGAPLGLRLLGSATAIQLSFMAAITPHWKISYHAATAAMLAAATAQLGSPCIVLAFVGLALAVGWSRLHLGRHTTAQVVAGFVASLPIWIAVNL